MTRPAARLVGRAPAAVVAAGLALLAVGATACSGSEQSPAEARRERVEARLEATFSNAQARCILDRAQPDLLRALDRTTDLSPDAGALTEWSDVLVGCVTDPDGTATTSSTAGPSTPSTTSTTAAGGLGSEVSTTTR